MSRSAIAILIIALTMAGCHSTGGQNSAGSHNTQSTKAKGRTPDAARPVAMLEGEPVSLGDIGPALLEASGGTILSEWVLGRAIDKSLSQQGLKISKQALDAEIDILRSSLSSHADQGQKLLDQIRRRRGLGAYRFDRMLRRNAGLRMLIRDKVQVNDPALRQAYDMEYGPRYETRLIVVETLAKASDLVAQAKAGKSFADLAVQHSTDPSRKQGGLLSPMSPADMTYPKAVRSAVAKLKVGQVSAPIGLENGFALLRLERKIDAKSIKFDDVKDELSERVRRRLEQIHMQRLARQMLTQADIIVLDRQLKAGWDQARKSMLQEK